MALKVMSRSMSVFLCLSKTIVTLSLHLASYITNCNYQLFSPEVCCSQLQQSIVYLPSRKTSSQSSVLVVSCACVHFINTIIQLPHHDFLQNAGNPISWQFSHCWSWVALVDQEKYYNSKHLQQIISKIQKLLCESNEAKMLAVICVVEARFSRLWDSLTWHLSCLVW